MVCLPFPVMGGKNGIVLPTLVHISDLDDLGYPTLGNQTMSIDMSKKRWAQCDLAVSTRSYLVPT